jgi:cytoskeletal protein RodZ
MESDDGDLRVRFGAALRAARDARRLDAREAATACQLSEDQVLGLENNRSGSFYSPAYLARAARHYAEFLDVPVPPDYGQAPAAASPAGPVTVDESTQPAPTPLWLRPKVLIIVLVLAAVAVAAVTLRGGAVNDEPQSANPVAVAQAEPPPPPQVPVAVSEPVPAAPEVSSSRAEVLPPPPPDVAAKPPAAARSVREDPTANTRFYLQVFADVGLTVKDSSGKLLVQGHHAPSEGRRVTGSPPFTLVVTQASDIAVFYRGQRVRPVRDAAGEWRAEFGAP